MSEIFNTTTATRAEVSTDAAELLSEIRELERLREEEGLRVLSPDDCACAARRDSRVIRALVDQFKAYPEMHNSAAALIACEIEARKILLRALEAEVAQ